MAEQEAKAVKKSRFNTRTVLKETDAVVVTDIAHNAYKGEPIRNTVRQDHKFDPKVRTHAGRPL